jgi:ubiquinone biosynthesis protein
MELITGAKALSRLVQEPPVAQTVIIERNKTPTWIATGVVVATLASLAALVLSLWPIMTG